MSSHTNMKYLKEGVGGEGEKKFSQLYTITDFFSL